MPATPCTQPKGDAKYDESKSANVPRVNATAIVTVWCGPSSAADASTTVSAPMRVDRIGHVAREPCSPT